MWPCARGTALPSGRCDGCRGGWQHVPINAAVGGTGVQKHADGGPGDEEAQGRKGRSHSRPSGNREGRSHSRPSGILQGLGVLLGHGSSGRGGSYLRYPPSASPPLDS
ncbi:hypothetical protein T484DRAFT_3031309 [Baffinella frigidus]|nr:hypothetical protein T484DRAFT_3031309 [Cryptophyta sp. CCMP2293]